MPIPLDVVELACHLREVTHRGRNGTPRPRSWQWVSDELRRRKKGIYAAADLARAVAAIPVQMHPRAGLRSEEMKRIEESWRRGWAENFPGEKYPGLLEAQRRIASRSQIPWKDPK
jgi:hypothetical protein